MGSRRHRRMFGKILYCGGKRINRGGWFLSLVLVSADVQSAMEALAEVEKCHAVHVEVVAAPGTTGESRIGRHSEEENEPDGKDYFNGMVCR